MLPYNARTKDRGFTLLEMAITLLVLGILSAIAVPSFIAMLNRNKINDALASTRGALQEAQRQALRKSKNCTVIVPSGNNITLTSPSEDTDNDGVLDAGEDLNSNGVLDTNTCLITGDRTLKDINLAHNKTTDPWVINFDFKGRTNQVSSAGTMVFALADGTEVEEKCIVISQGLGIIRTGKYTGTGAISATDCETSR